MKYEAKDFSQLIGLGGFSDNALNIHFSLYQGYVNNTNKLLEALDLMLKEEKTGTPEFSETKRRLGWEFNGMRLHEYYFSAISKNPVSINQESELYKKIVANFGSFENWEKDFRATASCRGIGWVILYYDKTNDCLINFWIGEHDEGHPVGLTPLLNIDVFEHAFMLDYGTKRADYIDAFMKVVDWQEIEKRFMLLLLLIPLINN